MAGYETECVKICVDPGHKIFNGMNTFNFPASRDAYAIWHGPKYLN